MSNSDDNPPVHHAEEGITMTTTRFDPKMTGQIAAGSFVASASLTADLQAVLVDLVALHVTGKQAHWTVTGPGFRSLHLALDDLVKDARDHADAVAERMRSLRAVPDGRLATTAATSTISAFPVGEVSVHDTVIHVTEILHRTVAAVRRVHNRVDDADPTSADLLHVVIGSLEQHAWMISAEVTQ